MSEHCNSEIRELPNPFGIYVHIPFCVHKCSYCDFYSFTKYDGADFTTLEARLAQELREAANWLAANGRTPSPAVSLFFGGGTPSLFPVDGLAKVFGALQTAFPVREDAEITLEANPETVSDEFLRGLLSKTPVNRVSLGAQSFSPDALKKLERLGSPESIRAAAKKLREHGIDNFNLDLIFAIPGQGKEGLLFDIENAARLEPRHISFYNLTLKPAHVLYEALPDDDEAAELYEVGMERLRELGYEQYEISNFSRPGFASRHNSLYWDGGDYLGVGPSAASRFFWDGVFHHRKALSDYRMYAKATTYPDPAFEKTTTAQTVLEATFLELRKNEGVNLATFNRRYGYDLTKARKFPLFEREALVKRNGEKLLLSHRGRLLADSVTRDLVDY